MVFLSVLLVVLRILDMARRIPFVERLKLEVVRLILVGAWQDILEAPSMFAEAPLSVEVCRFVVKAFGADSVELRLLSAISEKLLLICMRTKQKRMYDTKPYVYMSLIHNGFSLIFQILFPLQRLYELADVI